MDNGLSFAVHLTMEFRFDEQKNRRILLDRGVSFHDAIDAITGGDLLEVLYNPNQQSYPGQLIVVVRINDYPYCVPVDVRGEVYYLRTVYPCRKFKHLLEGDPDG
jgi:uncharacterized DUF497 family protein